jgi:serine/threonine protein phosphatase PrpC
VNRTPRTSTRAELSTGVVCSLGLGPDRGGRPANQDNYLVCAGGRLVWREGDVESVTFVQPGAATVLAVADGMGGHEDGDVASASAVQAMARLYLLDPPADPEAALRTFMLEAHRRIRDRVAELGDVKMGTTLTVAWVLGATVWWGHIGDSRLYHWRNGRITRITRDQTREEFAQRDGRPTPTHPRYLAQNFIYGSRGLGHDAMVRMDRGIDTGSFSLLPGTGCS